MKKKLITALMLAMSISFAACGAEGQNSSGDKADTKVESSKDKDKSSDKDKKDNKVYPRNTGYDDLDGEMVIQQVLQNCHFEFVIEQNIEDRQPFYGEIMTCLDRFFIKTTSGWDDVMRGKEGPDHFEAIVRDGDTLIIYNFKD